MREPRLSAEDRAAWESLRGRALAHARLRPHQKRVERARRVAAECIERHPAACLTWSGGKDSTALVHLVRVGLGADLVCYSEKDDLDYPGEREYVSGLADKWRLRLRVVEPAVSLRQWVRDHAADLVAGEDMHGRAAGLSKEHFYALMETATAGHSAIFLGLRADESHGRAMNRYTRGLTYEKQCGQVICQPIADWSGLDVYAYLFAHEIEPLHVYRCIVFMHADEPWRVRKSWWIPGAHSRKGATAWLRHYYPSLYGELCRMMPGYGRET